MPEITIKYKSKKTLDALIDFSKYLDFKVILPKSKSPEKESVLNGVTIIAGDESVDLAEFESLFAEKKFDAKKLREKAWARNT